MATHAENSTGSQTLDFYSAYWVAEICIAILATVSNLIVLIAFCTNKKLRTIPNWYIASLSVSDLLMGTFGIPFILIALTGNPKNNYGLCVSAVTAIVWIEVCSCFTLFALSFDRYYAVCRPLEYTTKMSQRRALFHIMLAWLTPLIYSLLIPLVWNSGPEDSEECIFIVVVNLHSLMFAYLGFFLPMFSLECFMYYKIFQAIRNQLKRLSHMQEVGIRLHLTSVHESTNDVKLVTPSKGQTKNLLGTETRKSNQISKYIYSKQNHLSKEIAVDTEISAPTLSDQINVHRNKKEMNTSKPKKDLMYNVKVVDDLNVSGEGTSYLNRTSSCPVLPSIASLYGNKSYFEDNDINDNKMASDEVTQFSTTRTGESKQGTLVDISPGGKLTSSNKICDSNSIAKEGTERKEQVLNEKRAENNTKLLATGTVNQIQSSRYRQERKTAVLFVFILLFFFASWSPVYIIDICLAYKIDVNQGLVNFAVLLSHFNSAFNPIFYAYKKEFRNVLKSWRKSLQRFVSSKCTKTQQNQIHPSSVW